MDLAPYTDRLTPYLASFAPLIGDARTQRLFDAVVEGLLITGTPICSQIAAATPECAADAEGQRVRRFVNGQTTKRSDLDAPHLTAALRERTLAHLQAAPPAEVWLIVDGSDLRKPQAHTMQYLDRVPALKGGTVPGYHTLHVIAVVPGYRGLLYQHVFSTHEPGFRSISREVQTALTTVSAAIAAALPDTRVIWIMDAGFDDIAVWRTLWQAGQQVVSRTYHDERRIRYRQAGLWHEGTLAQATAAARRQVSLETEMEVRLRGQRTAKRQRVTVDVAVCRIAVPYDPSSRDEAPSGTVCWQRAAAVVVSIRDCDWAPWVLVTDVPVGSPEAVRRVFMMYRQRWSIEDAFKFTKTAVAWEQVQLLTLEGVRRMVALAWVAAGFLYELGVDIDDADVQILARLGGWAGRADRPPGKAVLARGLARVLDMLATAAVLETYRNEAGELPPPLQALLNRYGQFVGFSAEL
jgi:Transposase DDE domain